MNYVDGFVVTVPAIQVERYKEIAESACKVWMEHGALDYRECMLEDGNGE